MIYISLGSNLGNRLLNLQKAVNYLRKKCSNISCSIILETDALLQEDAPSDWQKPFLNMVVFCDTILFPQELFSEIKEIEKKMGRQQVYKKWSPRIIDIDILLWGDFIINTKNLTIPHPEINNRWFLIHLIVMMTPHIKHPISGENFAKITSNFDIKFSKSFVVEPKLVGIVNVTPDSFSDGNLYLEKEKAIGHVLKLHSDGASVVDIGAQSTRPGADIISSDEEYTRLEPILSYFDSSDIVISVDTFNSLTILKILEKHNINWINDIKSEINDDILKIISSCNKKIVIMHSLSVPPQKDLVIDYEEDPIMIINDWMQKKIEHLLKCGFSEKNIIIDPGIGFGKSHYQNIGILRNIEKLKKYGCEILVGHSRKSYISSFNKISSMKDRDIETIAISNYLKEVDYLRVHNIEQHQRFFVTQQVII